MGVPAIAAGLPLGFLGVVLYRFTKREDWEVHAYWMTCVVVAVAVWIAIYVLMSRVLRAEQAERWGGVLLGSCCAARGIGMFLAGVGWAIARARRSPRRSRRSNFDHAAARALARNRSPTSRALSKHASSNNPFGPTQSPAR